MRAAGYKLVLETHVAPFIVAAWIFGTRFDEEFLAVKEVLEDYEMDCGLKAQWLWDFIDVSVGVLEDGVTKNESSCVAQGDVVDFVDLFYLCDSFDGCQG